MHNIHSPLALIIVTGHRKSGTTLLHRLLDGHDALDIYPVDLSLLYAYFPCFTQSHKNPKDLQQRLLYVVKQSLSQMRQYDAEASSQEFFVRLQQQIKNIDLLDKTQVINALHQAWIGDQQCHLPFLIKETSQSVHFNDYKKRFPLLKMVSIIRDPRDNFAAIASGVEGHYAAIGENHFDSLSSHINRARMDLLSAKLNQQQHPESFLAIRFEDLTQDPEKTMHQVTQFLNIDFKEHLLSPQISGQAYTGNNYDGKQFSGISQQHVGAWKQRISQADAQVIEYWLHDVMQDWGYACHYDLTQSQQAFAEFYQHYNCRYFFNDNFAKSEAHE